MAPLIASLKQVARVPGIRGFGGRRVIGMGRVLEGLLFVLILMTGEIVMDNGSNRL